METAIDAREARKMFDENLKKVCNQVLNNFYSDVKCCINNCRTETTISFDNDYTQLKVLSIISKMGYTVEDMGGHYLIRW